MNGGGGGSANSSSNLEWRFNQTLRGVQGLLKGKTFPGKVLLTRRSEPEIQSSSPDQSQEFTRSYSENGIVPEENTSNFAQADSHGSVSVTNNTRLENTSIPTMTSNSSSLGAQTYVSGARATDTARLAKFIKELSRPAVILEKLRELSWSGIPPYMRPNIWRLLLSLMVVYHTRFNQERDELVMGEFEMLLGYAPSNSDRREGVLSRKRLDYVDYVSQYYDIPDSERSDDEISMLRQISVDCPRTVPDANFFQNDQVQKSLERILYTWAIRHPASGYVQGINDLVTPFFVVFLSEYLNGSIDSWSVSDLSPQTMSNIEADCYWCLTKLLDGMQDHYTFAQPGIQRLVFKLKELVRRIDEPVSRHMEEQGLDFLQFAFRWFNCLLIREIPFHLVTRLWDTYLAEGDDLPEFLVYISASLLLTWSDQLQTLEFQEMVMFLQHPPTKEWTHHELEMVLSRAYMWHTMFNSSPSHLAS